jgi:predicted RNase H-like HicB family nuclease
VVNSAAFHFIFGPIFSCGADSYIAFIEEFPGANTQGASLEECRRNLREAVTLVVEANRIFAREDVPVGAVIREPFNVTA